MRGHDTPLRATVGDGVAAGNPWGVGIVDTMLGIPEGDRESWYAFLRPQLRDTESLEKFKFPAQYMFRDVPGGVEGDPVEATLAEMDRHGIEMALIGHGSDGPHAQAARRHPERFLTCVPVDPNGGLEAVRALRRAVRDEGAVAAQWFPAGSNPQVPIDDARAYPIYAACEELGVPIFVCVGVPGPRVPLASQHAERVDVVCAHFPGLAFVMRHGAEPWATLAVELMRAWPNLSYSTSAFAPRYYPQPIIDYANGDGAERVLYAGYFPMGLSLERIMREMTGVPLREEVWPLFLRENALRLLRR